MQDAFDVADSEMTLWSSAFERQVRVPEQIQSNLKDHEIRVISNPGGTLQRLCNFGFKVHAVLCEMQEHFAPFKCTLPLLLDLKLRAAFWCLSFCGVRHPVHTSCHKCFCRCSPCIYAYCAE